MTEVLWESVYQDKPVRLIERGGNIVAEEASGRDQMARPVGWHPIQGEWPEPVIQAYGEFNGKHRS